jgi:hypothetical protein
MKEDRMFFRMGWVGMGFACVHKSFIEIIKEFPVLKSVMTSPSEMT